LCEPISELCAFAGNNPNPEKKILPQRRKDAKVGKFEARNSKSEIRNKFKWKKITKFKTGWFGSVFWIFRV